MQRQFTLLLALTAGVTSSAGAQTVKAPGGLTYTLKACTRLDNSLVRCTFALQSQYQNRPFLNAAD
ncbi:hypothetical protein [Deinococcus sp. QL22]|uniref:hypothetical protein n=1 Tax=Deinococcus sp. QL22 TaxID=2939437 RepID=UPI0020176E6F|nr:hypothetical protein [Deinococcus sp. QL22]UQN07967.1 hypothetical protein M1R55_17875 [Deinococcus sp. QL22]